MPFCLRTEVYHNSYQNTWTFHPPWNKLFWKSQHEQCVTEVGALPCPFQWKQQFKPQNITENPLDNFLLTSLRPLHQLGLCGRDLLCLGCCWHHEGGKSRVESLKYPLKEICRAPDALLCCWSPLRPFSSPIAKVSLLPSLHTLPRLLCWCLHNCQKVIRKKRKNKKKKSWPQHPAVSYGQMLLLHQNNGVRSGDSLRHRTVSILVAVGCCPGLKV